MNFTTYYELPQYQGSDKTAWLTVFNSAMAAIDAGIHEAKAEADANALNITTLQSTVETLGGAVSTQGTTLETLASTVTTLSGSVNTINSLIGNGEPTTTDKTIIGAINEINAKIDPEDVQVETLGISETSVEFDVPTSGDNLIDFYTSDGSQPTAIDTSVSGKVTLTFESAAYARAVYCKTETVTIPA